MLGQISLTAYVPTHGSDPTDFLLLTAVSLACGAVVGLERQLRGTPNGLKTCVLICFGAAAFTPRRRVFPTSGTVRASRYLRAPMRAVLQ